jgi:hypothetical protein
MSDLLKGLTSGGWGGLFAWIFPNALVVALLWFFVYQSLADPPFAEDLRTLEAGKLCVVLFALAAAVGVFASAASTPLYRILEGYNWPAFLQEWRKKSQTKRKHKLQKLVAAAPSGWKKGLYLEKLARFPIEDAQVVPTRLGNAIRSFETYGKSRFNLDSQTMWSELLALAPKSLQVEIDRSRAIVDFFVAYYYASLAAGILAFVVGIREYHGYGKFVFAGAMIFSTLASYQMAILSCGYWKSTVQSLVNLGRIELARSLGLKLPPTIEAEREMWGEVTSFVFFGKPEAGKKLDGFRRQRTRAGAIAAGASAPRP